MGYRLQCGRLVQELLIINRLSARTALRRQWDSCFPLQKRFFWLLCRLVYFCLSVRCSYFGVLSLVTLSLRLPLTCVLKSLLPYVSCNYMHRSTVTGRRACPRQALTPARVGQPSWCSVDEAQVVVQNTRPRQPHAPVHPDIMLQKRVRVG